MLRIITGLLILIACSLPAFAQAAKGVRQTKRARARQRHGTEPLLTTGNKTGRRYRSRISTSAKGRTPEVPRLLNPYRLIGRREVIITAVRI
jgi:hypothetical protein